MATSHAKRRCVFKSREQTRSLGLTAEDTCARGRPRATRQPGPGTPRQGSVTAPSRPPSRSRLPVPAGRWPPAALDSICHEECAWHLLPPHTPARGCGRTDAHDPRRPCLQLPRLAETRQHSPTCRRTSRPDSALCGAGTRDGHLMLLQEQTGVLAGRAVRGEGRQGEAVRGRAWGAVREVGKKWGGNEGGRE